MDRIRYFLIYMSCAVMLFVTSSLETVYAYEENNEFIPGAFPKKIIESRFTIPLDSQELIVIYPPSAESQVNNMQALLREKCGQNIPFRNAENLEVNDLRSKHLIVVGNISNNRWVLALYKRRFAFADTYFPGAGGVIIHPAESIWNKDRSVIVIGVSSDDDVVPGFARFVSLLEKNAANIGIIHHLDTALSFPKPPASVASTLDNVRENMRTTMAPYWSIANWGLLYFISGDTKWAEHFRDGFYLCYERAEKTGQWVPEKWTNLYFNLWKMVYVWELLDDDPFFTSEDHRIIEEVLWGYTQFVRWMPNLDEDMAPLDEGRQNHTTFLALSLYYSHRYYTGKYGITGLDSMVEKYHRAFDKGQAHTYRPNDDAGNYFYYAPLHLLTYNMAEGDDSFCSSGRLRSLIDLVTATIDNRRDPVSFGDVGGYRHRTKGSARGTELKFFGMGAWYYGDGGHQWLYNWGSKERVISLDTMKSGGRKEENPIQMQFGADRVFTVEAMYSGVYAVDIKEEKPLRYLGVFPVMLDKSSLRWSAMRSDKNSQVPSAGERYVDKIAFRRSFDPQDEYLLLDGISTFSHGHHDGNTVTRLTWKDRIWLFDLDYIKMTPKYHNGLIVVRNGVQETPPPLNVLDFAADFSSFGFSRTTSRDYNDADWERNIIWKKGRYFLFLDRVTAGKNGDYRLECRWRTRGDVNLDGNVLSVRQGDKSFFIKSADDAARDIFIEPDGHRRRWNYPYGNGVMSICRARKSMSMSPQDYWIFASLMYVKDNTHALPKELHKAGDGLYVVGDSENRELIGLNPDVLAEEGVYTDCDLFVMDSRHIWLLNASRLSFRDAYLEAPAKVHFEINIRERTGKLVVPEANIGTFRSRNLDFRDFSFSRNEQADSLKSGLGTYSFSYNFTFKGDFWKNSVPFMSSITAAQKILPGAKSKKPADFGIDILSDKEIDREITAICPDGNVVVYADTGGLVSRYDGSDNNVMFEIPSKRPISCMHAADIDGDGVNEIIAGDDRANVYCYETSGRQLWNHKMTRFYGVEANASDITVGEIDRSGKPSVLVANGGWKLYAFNPDGSVRWESFCYYHPLTKVRILDNGGKGIYIPVGTEYHTPLNVISPEDGKVIWHAWEEMGSEFLSTTEYCGFHLTDMVFIDTDDDGDREIVFGTKYNRIYALEAADGSTKWEANVGGEVTVMETFTSHKTGEELLLVGTDAGDLFLYNRAGQRVKSTCFGSGITDLETLSRPNFDRTDIIMATEDGRIIIYDDEFLVRASRTLGEDPILQIIPVGFKNDEYTFYAATKDRVSVLCYRPYFLKKSRHY